MKSKPLKRAIISVLALLLAVLLIAVGYLSYVVLSYSRVEDNLELKVEGVAEGLVPVEKELSLITYNIGFGAYSDDYSFFMDGGKYSRAYSKEAVIENTKGAIDTVKKENPDFVLFQEVDIKGTRSYHVNQSLLLADSLKLYDRVFAQNYNSAYLFYPFNEPIGANKSGVMTFSRFEILSSVRRSLPIEESLYKFLDLDRAYTVSVTETENGKKLIIYNVHLSAYTSDGSIADTQLEMLCEDMKLEYDKGNYVIAAGDFNKDMLGDSSKYFKRTEGDFTWAKPLDTSLLPKGIKSYSGSDMPTCRNADSSYRGDGTDFVLSVDGALVGDNIEVISSNTVDTGFKYSDHNPVSIKFILKN